MKASEGYFLAKRQMQDALESRVLKLESEYDSLEKISENVDKARALRIEINTLEKTRSYVRNVLLWNTKDGE